MFIFCDYDHSRLKSAAFPAAGLLPLLLPGSGARQGRAACLHGWEVLLGKRVVSVLVVFLSWPSLLCLCWSLSYSLSSATVGPFGICAGLVLLGEPDQTWTDVDHICYVQQYKLCSTYILKPLCPFFCLSYANLYANTAGLHSPV